MHAHEVIDWLYYSAAGSSDRLKLLLLAGVLRKEGHLATMDPWYTVIIQGSMEGRTQLVTKAGANLHDPTC